VPKPQRVIRKKLQCMELSLPSGTIRGLGGNHAHAIMSGEERKETLKRKMPRVRDDTIFESRRRVKKTLMCSTMTKNKEGSGGTREGGETVGKGQNIG